MLSRVSSSAFLHLTSLLLPAFAPAAAADDGPVLGWYRDAQAAAQAGQTEKAVGLYRKIVAARPDLAEAHANLGVLLFENQRYGEANDALSHALRRNPALHR